MKIIPICSADRERLGINRFRRFCGFGLDFGKRVNFLCFGGWFGEGAGKGEFFVDRCIGLGGFFSGGILTDCAECCEKVKHCQKKPSAFALFMSLFTLLLILVHLVK